jgi:(p)ppGpp synthase/HD superfamily hydrolase
MTPRPSTAYEFANSAHSSIGQVRKYSGLPYVVHPSEVAEILKSSGETDPEILCAAFLHDVLEDVYPVNPNYSPDAIQAIFGTVVLLYVKELTDEFTREKYPSLNRKKRKNREAQRIANISDGALKVKLADLIDNTRDIVKNDPGFAETYLFEKGKILSAIHERMIDCKDLILRRLYHKANTQWIFYSIEKSFSPTNRP